MCQQIVQFCSGSTRPLLFVGGFLSLLLAVAIGYTGCTTQALYNDIDSRVADSNSNVYLLQMATAGYLTLITIFSCYAAYYDQKHSIRALAYITALNFALALVALLMLSPSKVPLEPLESTLKQAASKYDFTDKGPKLDIKDQLERLGSTEPSSLAQVNSTGGRQVRWINEDPANGTSGAVNVLPPREINATEATQIWDRLQARGCCGIRNGTAEWKSKVPKSCCDQPTIKEDEKRCSQIDRNHEKGCLDLIASTSTNLLIVLSLIALVNFYLAIITGLSAYRTFHYDEASQSAYT